MFPVKVMTVFPAELCSVTPFTCRLDGCDVFFSSYVQCSLASQSLQFSWYTALFMSSFGIGFFGFDNRLLKVVWVQNVALMLCLLSARSSCSLTLLM